MAIYQITRDFTMQRAQIEAIAPEKIVAVKLIRDVIFIETSERLSSAEEEACLNAANNLQRKIDEIQ